VEKKTYLKEKQIAYIFLWHAKYFCNSYTCVVSCFLATNFDSDASVFFCSDEINNVILSITLMLSYLLMILLY
jgi:hypothetical protein